MKKRIRIIISTTSSVVVPVLLPSNAFATSGPFGMSPYLSKLVDFARGPFAHSFAVIGLVGLGIMLILDPQPGIVRKIVVILFGLLIIATSLNITNFFNITPGLNF
jgi:type IV secretory pathway VirB2 component (pilin)